MIKTDGDNFRAMMNTLHGVYSKKNPENDVLRVWWIKLAKFELNAINTAFDKWVDSQSHMPTPADILQLCKPITPIYNAIERKVDKEDNKQQAHEVAEMVKAVFSKDKTDYLRWAKNMDKNPEKYRSDHVAEARAILLSRGVSLA